MKYSLTTFFIVVIIYQSCNDGKQYTESIAFEEMRIKIDYPFLPDYENISLLKKNDNFYLGGYNNKKHSFDFINLTDTNVNSNFFVELQKEGPDQVISVNPFCFTEDNIILNDIQHITILSFQGKIVNKIKIDSLFNSLGISGFLRKPIGVSAGDFLRMECNDFAKSIIIPIIPPINHKDEIYLFNIGIKIDINNKESEIIPLTYPPELNNTFNSYAGLITPYIKDYPDRYIYNFPYSSNIYVYFKDKRLIETINLKSKNIKEKATPIKEGLNQKDKFEYEYKSQRYREVHYISELNKYFRFHHSEKEKLFNDRSSRNYLMVYNEKNKSQNEYVLPDGVSSQYIIIDNNLFILCEDIHTENEMKILKINLAKVGE